MFLACSALLLHLQVKQGEQQLDGRTLHCAYVSLYQRIGAYTSSLACTEANLPVTCPHQSYSPNWRTVSLASPPCTTVGPLMCDGFSQLHRLHSNPVTKTGILFSVPLALLYCLSAPRILHLFCFQPKFSSIVLFFYM